MKKRETDAAFLKRMRADLGYFKAAEEMVGEVDVPDFRRLVRLATAGAKFKSKLAVFDEFVRRAGN